MIRAGVLDGDGFEIVPSLLNGTEIEALRTALRSLGIAAGRRSLMSRVSEVAALAASSHLLGFLKKRLGAEPFAVRSIFFDKTPEANWLVPWHQDLSIAVIKRIDQPGYGPWSIKDGVPHAQPPAEILESLVTVRLHLDDCDERNGALRVIPGSHRHGRLSPAQIASERASKEEVICCVRSGDALLMRPLLLHASSEALVPKHRRVIHLEYATRLLPNGLEWAERAAAHSKSD
jgi:ectoine hydroxylase-related dioxygenase (phytanoyl-CoA dioxygenase family)